ncbi:electroneutral sodium bicarbonate exchanger 1 [Lingula anatina]|uniref:Anion exchange protein n=1 Tax=Lingula anatina TaxID=7574 RepID=A0A1S3ICF9_LINAN|nr:electroneutral sodium bicarbonate exchanger 1 [Lingula anatina]|eukprot:XP_013395927.1 electroneutral sodium bicarbonate exchanger 1 [Lingula anatina]
MADDEAIPDRGTLTWRPLEDIDIEGHRSDPFGVQNGQAGHHHHHHHKHGGKHGKHRKKHKDKDDLGDQPSYKPPTTPPSERVQFLLGLEDTPENETHDLFCEMDELFSTDMGYEWKETGRWIKFEEELEEGGERWSKPHVAALSLHSLFEARSCLINGTVLLDCTANNLVSLTGILLDMMVANRNLSPEHKDQVMEVLLCKHRHLHDKHRGQRSGLPIVRTLADIGRKLSSAKNLQNAEDAEFVEIHKMVQGGVLDPSMTGNKSLPNFDRYMNSENGSDSNQASDSHSKFSRVPFMKKIPHGAETANILVGEVDFLPYSISAFIRLHDAIMLADFTEVPVPSRFIFVLLGPSGTSAKNKQIGRSMATLMSDEVFHDVAYRAKTRQDLLAAIDEFLDQVTVLPPGEWDPSIRIEPPGKVPSQESRKTTEVANCLTNGNLPQEEEHGDPTLVRTGRFFGGLREDIKRKIPWIWSDIKDALHIQCVASFIFLYFACLTPIVTFGGLLGDATHNYMAAIESILAGAICGITYHLFSGQPLTIIGSTGPVLVFETIVFHFCEDNHLHYLSLRFWIGMWTCLFLMVMVAFDLSALVRYITRFTEESFASLISLIFIYEAFAKLFKIQDSSPVNLDPEIPLTYECHCVHPNATLNSTNITDPASIQHSKEDIVFLFYDRHAEVEVIVNATHNASFPWASLNKADCKLYGGTLVGPGCDTVEYVADVFFFSILLFFGTFVLAYALKGFKMSRFCPLKVRSVVSDFAVFTAIVVMLVVDIVIGLPTPKLQVPDTFVPTRANDRGWVVNPLGNPWWCIPAAIIPALLATILIFMDQQITAVIVNRRENKLVKGGGYHLDLFIIASLIAVCSLLGLPWFVAATVLSITHVQSLKKESECAAPGETPKFLGIREQRVTGVAVFLLIGVSVLLTSALKHLPLPILYGVFLYMGVSALKGVQFVDRLLIILMPPKYQPDYTFLRHVPLKRVHLFTAIQLLCLIILWVIKTIKSISIAFPLMVLAMCFVRKGMDYLFSQEELMWLDDVMPNAHRKEKEEQEELKKKEEEMENEERERRESIVSNPQVKLTRTGTLEVPLTSGNIMRIPANKLNQLNISEGIAKSSLWKTINETSQVDMNKHQKAAENQSPTTRRRLNPGPQDKSSHSPKPGAREHSPMHLDSIKEEGGGGQDKKPNVKFLIFDEEGDPLMTAEQEDTV